MDNLGINSVSGAVAFNGSYSWTKGGAQVKRAQEYFNQAHIWNKAKTGHTYMGPEYLAIMKKSAVIKVGDTVIRIRDLVREGLFKKDSAISIGRDPGCDCVVSDATASRHHCVITQMPKEGFFNKLFNRCEYELYDNSTNGTKVIKA